MPGGFRRYLLWLMRRPKLTLLESTYRDARVMPFGQGFMHEAQLSLLLNETNPPAKATINKSRASMLEPDLLRIMAFST
jgi:hypothetical protein